MKYTSQILSTSTQFAGMFIAKIVHVSANLSSNVTAVDDTKSITKTIR